MEGQGGPGASQQEGPCSYYDYGLVGPGSLVACATILALFQRLFYVSVGEHRQDDRDREDD
jgi:hypothetical protein